jgi:hypothetical protein
VVSLGELSQRLLDDVNSAGLSQYLIDGKRRASIKPSAFQSNI